MARPFCISSDFTFNYNNAALRINEVTSARMKIRPGMIEGFKNQAAQCIAEVKRKDPETLQYDWYISNDNTECEIRETYENSDALLAHVENLREPLRIFFEKFATDNLVIIYGDPSAQLLENAKSRGVDVKTVKLVDSYCKQRSSDHPHDSSSSLIGFTCIKCEQKWREKI
jgi:quinol monooxygenase YgiN